jgi:hypothetical protein
LSQFILFYLSKDLRILAMEWSCLRQKSVPGKVAAYEKVGYRWLSLSDEASGKYLGVGDGDEHSEMVRCGIRLY